MPDETHDAASNAQAAVRWAEREFVTTNLIHGRDEEGNAYNIIVRTSIVRTSDDQLLTMSQLLMVTLLDEFLNDHPASDIARLLDNWQIGQAMREAGPHRVVVTTHGAGVPQSPALPRAAHGLLILHNRYGTFGTSWERTPWHTTQRAAWEALRRASADG